MLNVVYVVVTLNLLIYMIVGEERRRGELDEEEGRVEVVEEEENEEVKVTFEKEVNEPEVEAKKENEEEDEEEENVYVRNNPTLRRLKRNVDNLLKGYIDNLKNVNKF